SHSLGPREQGGSANRSLGAKGSVKGDGDHAGTNVPTSPAAFFFACVRVISAKISNGWRKLTANSPPFQAQFETTKLRRRRFSRGSCFSKRRCAFWASSRSCTPSSI